VKTGKIDTIGWYEGRKKRLSKGVRVWGSVLKEIFGGRGNSTESASPPLAVTPKSRRS